MAQIHLQNITFGYEGSGDNVFENIDFSFDTDWKIGLIGRNGRGKTTLFSLLTGAHAFRGKIEGKVAFDYFPYTVPDKEKTGTEIVTETENDAELWTVMKKAAQLQLNEECFYRPFRTLSNGQQTKLLLAILFAKENNFLLIDEPTNYLDADSRACVADFLCRQKGFMVVSHDREFLDGCVDHIIAINRNDIEVQKGNFSSWWQNQTYREEFEQAQNEKLQKEIARLQTSIRQTKQWSDKVEQSKIGTKISGLKPDRGFIGHKAAKMAKRSKAIENRQNKAVQDKKQLLKNAERQDDLRLEAQRPMADIVLSVHDLGVRYGEKEIFGHVHFTVERGERVAVCGRNGCGKTSLLKIVLGENIPYSGVVRKSGQAKISYVSQTFDWVGGTLQDFAADHAIDRTKFMTLLSKLGFAKKQFDIPIESFSMGQKKKVLLAKSLCEPANFYVWDEPLNYIDVISRMQIEEMLKNSGSTMLFVEHDAAFVKAVATKTVMLG